jgi:hypothetical protein
MKQDAVLVMHCQYFSVFEHGVEGQIIRGNARFRPDNQHYEKFPRVVRESVAAWRINSLRGARGVPNPGGKEAWSMRSCPEGDIADMPAVERQEQYNELIRSFEEARRSRARPIIYHRTQCDPPYDQEELRRAGMEWRRNGSPPPLTPPGWELNPAWPEREPIRSPWVDLIEPEPGLTNT